MVAGPSQTPQGVRGLGAQKAPRSAQAAAALPSFRFMLFLIWVAGLRVSDPEVVPEVTRVFSFLFLLLLYQHL